MSVENEVKALKEIAEFHGKAGVASCEPYPLFLFTNEAQSLGSSEYVSKPDSVFFDNYQILRSSGGKIYSVAIKDPRLLEEWFDPTRKGGGSWEGRMYVVYIPNMRMAVKPVSMLDPIVFKEVHYTSGVFYSDNPLVPFIKDSK